MFLLIQVHSFNKYLNGACYMQNTVLGPEDSAVNKTKVLLSEAYILLGVGKG